MALALAAALAVLGTSATIMAVRFRWGRADNMQRRRRRDPAGAADPAPRDPAPRDPADAADPADAMTGLNPVDELPRPISEMSSRELADWARDDPDKLRRLLRREKRRRVAETPRRPAALSALYLAIPLGTIGTGGYALLVRGESLFHKLTLRENLTVAGVVFVVWLVSWPLIAALRRRSD